MRISDWSSDVCSSDLEAAPAVPLARIVEHARAEHMPAPAIVQPPGAPNLFGPPNGDTWTLTTQTQNRPLVRKVSYDPLRRELAGETELADGGDRKSTRLNSSH